MLSACNTVILLCSTMCMKMLVTSCTQLSGYTRWMSVYIIIHTYCTCFHAVLTLPFCVFYAQHHCRNCGGIFCYGCSDNRVQLPSSAKPVTVCDNCYHHVLCMCSTHTNIQTHHKYTCIHTLIHNKSIIMVHYILLTISTYYTLVIILITIIKSLSF